MATFKTSRNRIVEHFHTPGDLAPLTPEDIEWARTYQEENFPEAREVAGPTRDYNCHGFSLARSHGWFNYGHLFLGDDCDEVSLDSPRVGDVLVYYRYGVQSHSAVVTLVEDNEIIEVRSKWGDLALLDHAPDDVPEKHGRARELFRPKQPLAPDFDLMGSADKKDDVMTRQNVQQAIETISQKDVYNQLMIASVPEVRLMIIESLPGVQDLIDAGPEGGRAVLELFQKEETQANPNLSAIALYLLRRLPSKEAARPTAAYILSDKFSATNRELAAQAFLATAEIEPPNHDIIPFARREAEKFL